MELTPDPLQGRMGLTWPPNPWMRFAAVLSESTTGEGSVSPLKVRQALSAFSTPLLGLENKGLHLALAQSAGSNLCVNVVSTS